MNAKQLLVLIVFCGLVGTAGWYAKRNSQQDWDTPAIKVGDRIFPDFPVNEITKLVITNAEGTLELSKHTDHWAVDTSYGYYADFVKIANFLKGVKDLKVMQSIEIGTDDLGRLLLNTPDAAADAGVSVDFIGDGNKSLARLILGKDHSRKRQAEGSALGGAGSWPDGRYVYEPDSKTVALVSETFSNIKTIDPDGWIDTTFIRVDSKIKRAVVSEREQQLWSASRDKESDTLQLDGEIGDDEEVVQTKLDGIDRALRYPSFNKIGDPSATDADLGFGENRTFVAETFDGFTYKIDIGKKDSDDNYPLKIGIAYNQPQPSLPAEEESDEDKAKREAEFKEKITKAQQRFETDSKRYQGWVYLVSSYTVESMLLNRSDLVEQKEKPEKDNADSDSDGASSEVTTSTIGPTLPSPKVDATVVGGEASTLNPDDSDTGNNDADPND